MVAAKEEQAGPLREAAAPPWWDRPMMAFDTETSGVDPETSRIVSAAVVCVESAVGLRLNRSWLVDPGVPIPQGATDVHGITNDQVKADGIQAPFAIREILSALEEGAALGQPIVAMNARFDLTLLDREARRHGVAPLTDRVANVRVVDPFVIDKFIDQWRRGKRTLTDLCGHYAVRLEDAHDATADALATARLAWRMCSSADVAEGRYGRPSEKFDEWHAVRGDLAQLHAAQVRWAEDQAFGLADYFRRQGEHAKAEEVQTVWPVVPFAEVSR